MKKTLLILATLIITGCGKEDDKEKQQESYRMSYEAFCNLYFDGYLVNDTTGLINLTEDIKPNQDETTYLTGTKSQKLWIGKFSTRNKKSIKEYISQDDFPIDFVYDLYGKNEIAHMDLLSVNDIFDTPKGFACSIQSGYSLYTVYVFNSTHTKYYLLRDYDIYKGLSKWYNGTFLIRYYTDNENNILCLDEEGNTLFEGYIDAGILSHDYLPTNLKEFVYISYDDDSIFIKKGTLQTSNTPSQKLGLFSRTEDNEIYNCEFGSIENDILQLKLIITGKSGRVQNKDYKINIKTFELVQ